MTDNFTTDISITIVAYNDEEDVRNAVRLAW